MQPLARREVLPSVSPRRAAAAVAAAVRAATVATTPTAAVAVVPSSSSSAAAAAATTAGKIRSIFRTNPISIVPPQFHNDFIRTDESHRQTYRGTESSTRTRFPRQSRPSKSLTASRCGPGSHIQVNLSTNNKKIQRTL